MIRGFIQRCRTADPAPVRQQAMPASAVRRISRAYGATDSTMMVVTGALVTFAFFFLLRVGEYTPVPKGQARRTIPLRLGDLRLWEGTEEIPRGAAWARLERATGVTICLENQKNGQKGDVLHHERATDPDLCPVNAALRLIKPIRHLDDATPLGTYAVRSGRPIGVSATQVLRAVRHGAELDGLESNGFDLDRIGTHSLRAGGAVALRLAGYDDVTIRKLGRWSSDTFLIYIRNQIGNLAAGISSAMANTLTYHNVG